MQTSVSPKVLVLEDEWLIAEDLGSRLRDLGFEVLGPAYDCAAALEILFATRPDLAILDTQIGSETCEVVLEECVRQGVPILISTAHRPSDVPPFGRTLPMIGKPFDEHQIAQQLAMHVPQGLAAG